MFLLSCDVIINLLRHPLTSKFQPYHYQWDQQNTCDLPAVGSIRCTMSRSVVSNDHGLLLPSANSIKKTTESLKWDSTLSLMDSCHDESRWPLWANLCTVLKQSRAQMGCLDMRFCLSIHLIYVDLSAFLHRSLDFLKETFLWLNLSHITVKFIETIRWVLPQSSDFVCFERRARLWCLTRIQDRDTFMIFT